MSGLFNFVKKVFKKVRQAAESVLDSKVFKVVAVAAAAVFTGGAALGALGAAGSGGGLMATLSAGFQGGLSALGSVGTAIWEGVKAAGVAAKNLITGTAGNSMIAPGSELAKNAALQSAELGATGAGASAGAAAGKGFFADPLTKAAAVSTAGNMLSGYAQGRARQEELDLAKSDRLSRDRYGFNGYGESTGTLVNPAEQLKAITANQDPALRQGLDVSLDSPPGAGTGVAKPAVASPGNDLDSSMRNRLLMSLDSLKLQGAY